MYSAIRDSLFFVFVQALPFPQRAGALLQFIYLDSVVCRCLSSQGFGWLHMSRGAKSSASKVRDAKTSYSALEVKQLMASGPPSYYL